jgi:hypothetical protein
MAWFRPTITIVTLLAVATNAVAAGSRPCCCTQPAQESKRACCGKADVEPSQVKSPTCCAEKDGRAVGASFTAFSRNIHPALDPQSCCCVKSLPATPPAPRQAVGVTLRLGLHDSLACDALVLADFPPAKDRIRQVQPGMHVPAAPPPSILYGVWLK